MLHVIFFILSPLLLLDFTFGVIKLMILTVLVVTEWKLVLSKPFYQYILSPNNSNLAVDPKILGSLTQNRSDSYSVICNFVVSCSVKWHFPYFLCLF